MLCPPSVFKTVGFASRDASRYQLTSIYTERRDGKPYFVATSGKILCVTTWREEDNDEFPANGTKDISPREGFKAIIPRGVAEKLAKWKGPRTKPILENVALTEPEGPISELTAVTTDLDEYDAKKFRTIEGSYPDFSAATQERGEYAEARVDLEQMRRAIVALQGIVGKEAVALCRVPVKGDRPMSMLARTDPETGIEATGYVMPLVEG